MDAETSGKYAPILSPSKELLRSPHMRKHTKKPEKIKPRTCNMKQYAGKSPWNCMRFAGNLQAKTKFMQAKVLFQEP